MKYSFNEKGFNLVEVIVAIGLLAGVLLSIAGLFTYGGRFVKSGKEMTEALSIAQDILEELDKLGYKSLYTEFGSLVTDTSCTVDTITNSFAQKWQPGIDEKLQEGKATITLEPVGGSLSPPTFASGRGMRITIIVDWKENIRQRDVKLASMRF